MRVCPQCRQPTTEARCPDCRVPTIAQTVTGEHRVGTLFADRYEVGGLLGRGTLGSVYRALNVGLAIPVALRILRQGVIAGPAFSAALAKSSRLRHANTVRVLDHGEAEGCQYVATELLEGRSLRAELKRVGRLDEARILRIADQVCHSLAEAHRRRILHGDLRPENVFLSGEAGETDEVKVLDYGLAPSSEGLAGSGRVTGTPRYVSPEVARNESATVRSDLYSLGVTLYEAAAGAPPFMAETNAQVLLMHLHDKPLRLRAVWGDAVSEGFDELVMSLLAKNPDRRPRSVDKVIDRIAELRLQPPRLKPTVPMRTTFVDRPVEEPVVADPLPADPAPEPEPPPPPPPPEPVPEPPPLVRPTPAPIVAEELWPAPAIAPAAPAREPAPGEAPTSQTASFEAPTEPGPPPALEPPPAPAPSPVVEPAPAPALEPEPAAKAEQPRRATGEYPAPAEIPLAPPPRPHAPPPGGWGSDAAERFFDGRPQPQKAVRHDVVLIVAAAVAVCGIGFFMLWAGVAPPEPIPTRQSDQAGAVESARPVERKVALKAATLHVATRPEGATVTLLPGATVLGRSPVDVLVLEGEKARIRVTAPGYRDSEHPVTYEAATATPEVVLELEPVPAQ